MSSSPAILTHVQERAVKARDQLAAVSAGAWPRDINEAFQFSASRNLTFIRSCLAGELAWCELYLERGGEGDTDIAAAEERAEKIKREYPLP